MRTSLALFSLAAVLATQSVAAQQLPPKAAGPIAELQTQLAALAMRTQALEDSAPNSSVDGRSYCFVLNVQVMRGHKNQGTDELRSQVIRRSGTFSGGRFIASLLSNVENSLLHDNTVFHDDTRPTIDPVEATYTQTGTKIDIVFDLNSVSANWYVSKDGSLIHGTDIGYLQFGPEEAPVLTVGLLRNWTLTEAVSPELCDAEFQ